MWNKGNTPSTRSLGFMPPGIASTSWLAFPARFSCEVLLGLYP